MNIYRHFSDYYWNPQDVDFTPQIKEKLEVSIDECLRSQGVHNKITEACIKYGYKIGITKDMIRAFSMAGKDGCTTAGQKLISEITGRCLTTVQKYYRFIVQCGFFYSYHRNRSTDKGDRRTTNLTIITILLDYAERCKQFAKKAANKGLSLIPRDEGRIVSYTTPPSLPQE